MPDMRLLSRQVKVRWQGWEATTLTLQRGGWQLAVELDVYQQKYTLLLKNRGMKMYGISRATKLDFERMTQMSGGDYPEACFDVMHISGQIHVHHLNSSQSPLVGAVAINAEPCLIEYRITKIEDMNVFRPAVTKSEEILVEQADMSVIELLQKIKDKQSDRQKELRDKARMAERREELSSDTPQSNVVAYLANYR